MTGRVCIAASVLLCACAASPLRDARQMGFAREGSLRTSNAALVSLRIEVHETAPRTLPRAPALEVPPLPAVDGEALERAAVDSLQQQGAALGVSVDATDVSTEPDTLPTRFVALLGDDALTALGLTIHVGWCPQSDGWAACVRSPDTALGYGPPGVEGFLYSRFRARHEAAIAKRLGTVRKGFVYQIDPSGAHLDRPFVGRGETFQAQAEDATRQAAQAWLTVARGRRGQRILDAAMTDRQQ